MSKVQTELLNLDRASVVKGPITDCADYPRLHGATGEAECVFC